jgi:hypothetical protein
MRDGGGRLDKASLVVEAHPLVERNIGRAVPILEEEYPAYFLYLWYNGNIK